MNPYEIRFLGNKLQEIESVHRELLSMVDLRNPLTPEKSVFNHKTLELFKDFNSADYEVQSSSFLKTDYTCVDWHVDHGSKLVCHNPRPVGMIISSYPHPTEIAILQSISRRDFVSCDSRFTTTPGIFKSNLIKEVFVPNPGDIYLLGANVVHRANPNGKPWNNICFRYWLFEVVPSISK